MILNQEETQEERDRTDLEEPEIDLLDRCAEHRKRNQPGHYGQERVYHQSLSGAVPIVWVLPSRRKRRIEIGIESRQVRLPQHASKYFDFAVSRVARSLGFLLIS
jgi:hypothetical protein